MSMLAEDRTRTFLWTAFVVLIAGTLYFLTAARDIVIGDTPEFITAAVTFGVPHPSGYPLFTMLGHLFSLLPVGSIPFRLNLLSVICDAIAVGFVFLTALRLSQSYPASAIAALLLAVSPIFWAWSLAFEVFALNNLFAAVFCYLLVRWNDNPDDMRFLITASFVAGVAVANHQTFVLLGPAIVIVLWHQRAAIMRRPASVVICAMVLALGFLPYAYILWAARQHSAVNWGGEPSFKNLIWLIRRTGYGSVHLTTGSVFSGSCWARVKALFSSFEPWLGALAILGLIWAWLRKQWYFWFCLTGFLGAGFVFVIIANLDLAAQPSARWVLERFFMLPQLVVAPLAAPGLTVVAASIASQWPHRRPVIVRLLAGIIFVAIAINVVSRYRTIDQSRNHVARLYAEDIFASAPPSSILLLAGDETVLPLTYLQSVEGVRPDVTLIAMPLLPADWYLRQLKERDPRLNLPFDHYDAVNTNLRMLVDANRDRPMFVVRTLPANDSSLDGKYWLSPLGLTNALLPIEADVSLEQNARDNDQLLKKYRIPDCREIKTGSFEDLILFAYALPALRMGSEYERAGRKAEAASWYRRAVKIDPNLPDANRALARAEQQ